VTSDSTRSETLTTYDLSSECVFKLTGELSPHPFTRQAHTHNPFHKPLAPFSRSLFQVDTHLNSLCNTRFFSLNAEGGGGHSWATVQIVSVRSLFHFSSSPFLFFTFYYSVLHWWTFIVSKCVNLKLF